MSNQQTLLSNPDIAFPTQQALPRNSYSSILTKKILLSKPNQARPTLKIWSTKADPPNQKKNIKKDSTPVTSKMTWQTNLLKMNKLYIKISKIEFTRSKQTQQIKPKLTNTHYIIIFPEIMPTKSSKPDNFLWLGDLRI